MSLVARLERPLPAALPMGSSTAVLVIGTCFDPHDRIERLEILVDGTPHRPAAFGMPRPDLAGADGQEAVAHSGFWGTVTITAPKRAGRIELGLAARLAGGGQSSCALGEIEMAAQPHPPALLARPARRAGSRATGLIAVCMATYEPDMSLLHAQVRSLAGQTDDHWVCLISDDCSSPDRFGQIRALVAGDPRFSISRSEAHLGFYRNFERALGMVPPEAELIALCDQDDRWHPDKLSVLRQSLDAAALVYSDQRLVTADGRVLRDTLWKGRGNNHRNLASMLVANTITGAAMLFRREVAELALPFPDTPGIQFHDHWLAAVALAAGDVAYVDRPLYDYVQHPGAVFGDVTHGSREERTVRGQRALQVRGLDPTGWRAAYFYGFLVRQIHAQALLVRCADRLTARKRRALELLVAGDSSTSALLWLWARALRRFVGRTETLGSETELAQGVAWKRATAALSRRRHLSAGPFADASVPPLEKFSQKRLRRWRAQV